MFDRAPPSRYRIEEKGGRLIVTDTLTGQRNASADMPRFETGLSNRTTLAKPPSTTVKPTAPAASPWTMRTKGGSGSAPESPSNDRAGRIIMLVMLGLMLLAFLIWTGAWILVVFILFIQPVRALALAAVKQAVKRFLDGSN